MDVHGLFSFFVVLVLLSNIKMFFYVVYDKYPNIFSTFIFKKTNIQSLKENVF